jgi:branched-chain amino acid aminotransferase
MPMVPRDSGEREAVPGGPVAASPANLVHFEGALVPETEAKISALSPAMTQGPIAYETLRGYWNGDRGNLFLFRLQDHLSRLAASMKILRFAESFSGESISAWIKDVVCANGFREDVHIRMSAYPLDREGPGRSPARTGLVIRAHPRGERAPDVAHCLVSSWVRRGGDNHPARVKAVGSRMFSRASLAQAALDGYTDLIVQDERGKVLEATTSNLFLKRRGRLATPAVTEQILEGITRDTLIVLAGDLGIPCDERQVDRTELYDCEEAFLSSTGLEIVPIASVDRLAVGAGAPGPTTAALRTQYRAVVRGTVPAHEDWLTGVYDSPMRES